MTPTTGTPTPRSPVSAGPGPRKLGPVGSPPAAEWLWVPALHELNGLGGQSSVLLRFAFGSDSSVQGEGLAFDDIVINQAFVPYPGTVGGDVLLGTGVNGVPSSGLNQFVKTATGLDAINSWCRPPWASTTSSPTCC